MIGTLLRAKRPTAGNEQKLGRRRTHGETGKKILVYYGWLARAWLGVGLNCSALGTYVKWVGDDEREQGFRAVDFRLAACENCARFEIEATALGKDGRRREGATAETITWPQGRPARGSAGAEAGAVDQTPAFEFTQLGCGRDLTVLKGNGASVPITILPRRFRPPALVSLTPSPPSPTRFVLVQLTEYCSGLQIGKMGTHVARPAQLVGSFQKDLTALLGDDGLSCV